jgi:HNH endonuclease
MRGLGVNGKFERKPVLGWPGWEADTDGRVYRHGIERGTRPPSSKYFEVSNGKGGKVNRATLVCIAFHGPRPLGLEVCHKNDVSGDDRPENLYWGTHSQNIRDSYRNGIHDRKGEKNGRCVLTDDDCAEIKILYDKKSGITQTYLANIFGVSQVQISKILRGAQRCNT